ncbi:hypothetical protein AAG906_015370 [Vitis piasezkii]
MDVRRLAFIGSIGAETLLLILGYTKSGIEAGATFGVRGEKFGSKGYYIQSTDFSNVRGNMLIATEKILIPVQFILKFKDLDEVIGKTNAAHYELIVGVFAQSLDTSNILMRALKVGTVWVGCFDVSYAAIPFDGFNVTLKAMENHVTFRWMKCRLVKIPTASSFLHGSTVRMSVEGG